MDRIKALIIDDEEPGRRIIRDFLDSHPEVEISGECRDAYEALDFIERVAPALLFLDVQMPEIDGFALLEMLENIPLVVFTTAYDRYALKAFEVNAVDYLLKPFDQERFDHALERVKERLYAGEKGSGDIRRLLETMRAGDSYLDRILVKKGGKMIVIRTEEIRWVEAMGDYVNLHTLQGEYLALKTMNFLEKRFDPERFVRAHRSAIVNLEAVTDIIRWTKGRFKVRLKDGREILASRAGAQRLRRFML
jgi:two-component system LytT family response regulator